MEYDIRERCLSKLHQQVQSTN